MSAKTELSAERLAEEKKKKAAEELARDVAYHQAIVMRGTTREASSLLFRLPLAGR